MIELLNMDCMDYMRECEDNAFDLAIVDPPYGIGDFSMSQNKKGKIGKKAKWKYSWNDDVPDLNYFAELSRVAKDAIIWGANYYNCFSEKGGGIVWFKDVVHPNISKCEIASCTHHKKVEYIRLDWTNTDKYNLLRGADIHPCQKPVGLYMWLLENYAKPGQRILDTHLGSGSSAIAAYYFGCDFVGMEIDEDYYKAAVERFNNETKQVAMF